MKFRSVVIVQPKEGISDPEGATIKDSAEALEHKGVLEVRAGRSFVVWVEAPDEGAAYIAVEKLSAELLANPVIQEFSISEVETA